MTRILIRIIRNGEYAHQNSLEERCINCVEGFSPRFMMNMKNQRLNWMTFPTELPLFIEDHQGGGV